MFLVILMVLGFKNTSMKLVDLFYYMICSLQMKYRDNGDAKFSSILALSAFTSFLIIDIIIISGIIYNNRVFFIFDKYVKEGGLSIWIIMILTAILFYIRYYKFVSLENIEEKLDDKTIDLTTKNIIITLSIYFFPFVCFVILCCVKG